MKVKNSFGCIYIQSTRELFSDLFNMVQAVKVIETIYHFFFQIKLLKTNVDVG